MFFVKYVNKDIIIPKNDAVSAVFLVAIKDDQMLAIENERGWDIPGGHVEKNETPEEGLIREVMEEGGAIFKNEELFAIIEQDTEDENYKDKVMFIYTTTDFELKEFTPSEDAFNREIISIEEFKKRYMQSLEGLDLKSIITKIQAKIKAGQNKMKAE